VAKLNILNKLPKQQLTRATCINKYTSVRRLTSYQIQQCTLFLVAQALLKETTVVENSTNTENLPTAFPSYEYRELEYSLGLWA
jgi:hypothetical protein